MTPGGLSRTLSNVSFVSSGNGTPKLLSPVTSAPLPVAPDGAGGAGAQNPWGSQHPWGTPLEGGPPLLPKAGPAPAAGDDCETPSPTIPVARSLLPDPPPAAAAADPAGGASPVRAPPEVARPRSPFADHCALEEDAAPSSSDAADVAGGGGGGSSGSCPAAPTALAAAGGEDAWVSHVISPSASTPRTDPWSPSALTEEGSERGPAALPSPADHAAPAELHAALAAAAAAAAEGEEGAGGAGSGGRAQPWAGLLSFMGNIIPSRGASEGGDPPLGVHRILSFTSSRDGGSACASPRVADLKGGLKHLPARPR